MLKSFLILKQIISFIIGFIFLYAFYIQLNGEVSPGGGFQAGVIFASGLIGYELIYGKKKLANTISEKILIICSVMGVLLYASTGLISLILGDKFLNYSVLLHSKIHGQHLGIFLIEIGVGITVSSVMYLIYQLLQE